MRTRQAGFTLVELLIVAVLTAVTLGAIYETLISQERSYSAARVMIHDQESMRTAVGILESELREISTIGGAAIGSSDILALSSSSITFRAHRNTAFLCTVDRADKWAYVWTLGDPFETGDSVILFVDNEISRSTDDRWDTTTVTSASSATDASCDGVWADPLLQYVKFGNQDLTGVQSGAPIRGYQEVTYGLYDFGPLGWGLGRKRGDGSPTYLVGGLAGSGSGLQFDYFDSSGAATTDPAAVARIQITIRTDPATNTGVQPSSMTSTLYLRN